MDEASPSGGAPAVSPLTRLVVFSAVVLGSGWIGLLVDDALGAAHSMKGQGSLVWIMTPLLVGAVLALSDPSLRRSYAVSWLPGRLRAYGVAIGVFPLSFVVAIAVGWAAGVLSPGGLGAFGSAVAVNVLPTVLKNIAEEGAWRGYLTPGLLRRRLPDPAVWLVVGVVWGAWHLPYYLWFLDESLIRSVYDVPPIIFALIAVPVTICWVPLFTELRILSGSIWPGLIAHSIANLSQIPLTLGGLPIKPGWGLLVSPMVGIIPNAIVLAAGLGLWARRTGRLRGRSR
ncbi:CAAX protease family protein [Actinomyces naeslundii]|uniref:CPBP family glutamic-type intramembrane protease n=1 Tax=Actinomyces naeslundii TaxID=1655 RepID=UPI00096E06DB|nr:CPBP family glutamic-type intramembrane protease [Actinomyces naeslundii]OMG29236.1 CAAX protease family protein [Actinomyces naeslundii]